MQRSTRAVIALTTVAGCALGALPATAVAGPPDDEAIVWADDPSGGDPPDRSGLPTADFGVADAPATSFSPDEVLVRFAEDASPAQQRSALSAAGTVPGDAIEGTDFVVVPTDGQDPVELVAQLDADPRVAEVQLNYVRTADGWTDDPLLDVAWPYFYTTRLPRAWDLANGTGTVIAVVDTGVDATHEDLAGRVLAGYDFVNGDANPADDNGHGTAVAGTAAARGNNAIGIVGAAWNASVLPVKVLNAAGQGDDADVAAGITYAADHGADIINLSLGGVDESPSLLSAIEYAVSHGSVVVAAAGNAGSDAPHYPAAYAPQVDGLIAVGATDDWGTLTEFSSWGDWVSVTAPGLQIGVPSGPGLEIGVPSGVDGYSWASGTSFAAPLVSGVAALVIGEHPTSSPAATETAIVSTARDAGPRGVDPFYGRGVLDAAAALGVAPAIPFDRLPGDTTPEDGLPDRAQGLGSTPAEATLSPEGDADWYQYTAATTGWYRVSVSVLDVVEDGFAALKPEVEVRDADGNLLGQGTADETNADVEVLVPASEGAQIDIGVTNANGSASSARYEVAAAFERRTLFDVTNVDQVIAATRSLAADVTGDTVPDVVTAFAHSATLEVRAGLGDGTFAAPVPVAIGAAGVTTHSNPGLVAFDADGDGDTDIAIGTTTGFQLLKQATGTLTSFGGTAFSSGAFVMKAADMDGDLDLDLVVTRSLTTALTAVLLNNGSGTFTQGETVASAYIPSFAVGDVTGDGRPDVVTAPGAVYVQQQPAGTFSLTTPLGTAGQDVLIGDLTGDRIVDVVRAVGSYPEYIAVHAGTGGGAFGAVANYPAGNTPRAIELADIDEDGRPDVVLPNQSNKVAVLYGLPGGALSAGESTWTVRWTASHDAEGLTVVDLDDDGYLDAVASGSGGFSVLHQVSRDPIGGPGWIRDASPEPHTSGVGVRPTITLKLEQALDAGAVTAQTVRLIDGLAATDVAASRSYDSVAETITITPTSDLVPGRHYAVRVSGLTAATDAVQPESYWTWFTVGAAGARFTPVEPWRVLDTRSRLGARGPVVPGSPIVLRLGGVEIPSEATAVVLNVTAASPAGNGNIRVYPTPVGPNTPPLISSLNVVSGVDQPNLVTVSLGNDGAVSLATDGTVSHLIADVAGYYSEGGATAFVPLSPVRVMDTRSGTGGVPQARVQPNRWVDLVVTGRNGVPADASAVVLNVTGVQPSGVTNVRVYPTPAASEDQAPPTVSNLNLVPGRDQPNLVTVTVGDGGRVRFYTQTAGLDLVADLAGYYSPTGDHGYVPLSPTRIADTRNGVGFPRARLQAGVTSHLTVGGVAGVPTSAAAVVLNVTAVQPGWLSNVRVFPTPATPSVPLVSNLNIMPGRDEPNMVIVRLGDQGRVSVYSQTAQLDMVVDLGGYFARYSPE